MNLFLQFTRRQMWIARGAIALLLLLILILVTFGPGGTRIDRVGNTTTYSGPWLPTIVFASLGALTSLAGFFYWRQKALFFRAVGAVLFLFSIFALVNSPTGLNHRVIVTPDYFFHRIGYWYSPVENRVEFDSLIYLEVDRDESDPRTRGAYELHCVRKSDGKDIRIPIHDLMKKALSEIFKRAAARNVIIGDSPDGRPIPSDLRE